MYSKIQAKVIYKVDTIQHSGNISSSLIRREICICSVVGGTIFICLGMSILTTSSRAQTLLFFYGKFNVYECTYYY